MEDTEVSSEIPHLYNSLFSCCGIRISIVLNAEGFMGICINATHSQASSVLTQHSNELSDFHLVFLTQESLDFIFLN